MNLPFSWPYIKNFSYNQHPFLHKESKKIPSKRDLSRFHGISPTKILTPVLQTVNAQSIIHGYRQHCCLTVTANRRSLPAQHGQELQPCHKHRVGMGHVQHSRQTVRDINAHRPREHRAHTHEPSIVAHRQRGQTLLDGHRLCQAARVRVPLLQVAHLPARLAQRIGQREQATLVLDVLDRPEATPLEQVLDVVGSGPLELHQFPATLHAPHAALAVLGDGRHTKPVRTKVHVVQLLGVRRNVPQLGHLRELPHTQMAVGAARRHQLAVEGETHHALDGLAVREVGLHRVRGFDVEQEAATSV